MSSEENTINGIQKLAIDFKAGVTHFLSKEYQEAEGKKGGQFQTPRSVVELLVEMLELYYRRVFDPCWGSAGMFIQSAKFSQAHENHYQTNGFVKVWFE